MVRDLGLGFAWMGLGGGGFDDDDDDKNNNNINNNINNVDDDIDDNFVDRGRVFHSLSRAVQVACEV